MGTEILCLYLKNHHLFADLNQDEINELCAISKYERFQKDQMIYQSDKEIDRLYIIIQGRIKISFCVQQHMEVVSEILKEGDIFGEITLVESSNMIGEFAKVLTRQAIIHSFSLNDFEKLLRRKNSVAIAYAKMVADKLKIINTKYANLTFKDVKERVLNFFKLHAKYEGKWSDNKVEIKMFMSHQDIADFTASSRQTVSTIINNLIKENIIIYEGRSKVIIPDVERLSIQ
ncbi:MAG: Crp/Fnr family transcriptional regulator [Chitinophagales bacterium]|jgi:CRP/FNR family transcriptional regulator|nr:Crp/Fnr family transcriptional regulator [Chitinophagales bacterium]